MGLTFGDIEIDPQPNEVMWHVEQLPMVTQLRYYGMSKDKGLRTKMIAAMAIAPQMKP